MVDPVKAAEAREEKLRERLAEAGGYTDGPLKTLDTYFSTYSDNPRPEHFSRICQIVTDYRIMALPEHRFGLAGAMASVMALHPDSVAEWKKHFPSLLSSVDKAAPPLTEAEVNSVGHAEYLFMWWMVSRDEDTMTKMIRLAKKSGDVGTMIKALLIGHSNLPRVAEVLETEAKSWTSYNEMTGADSEVQALAQRLSDDPNVMCVGRQPDGRLVVVTFDGKCPSSVADQVPYIYRSPTKEEAVAFKDLIESQEDP